jgi:hypothetical protein
VFTTAGAVAANKRFITVIRGTSKGMVALQSEAKKTGVEVDQLIRLMSLRARGEGTTALQRNIRLTNMSIANFIRTVHEARQAYRQFFQTVSAPIRVPAVRAPRVVAHGVSGTGQFGTEMVAELAAMGTFESAAGLGRSAMDMSAGFSGILGTWIKLAATMEGARVTFDAMLGDTKKSEELLRRVTEFAAKTPFQRMDAIAASKRLLSITGRDIDANERLFKMSANIAALRPGSTMEQTAQGIVQATVGEFEILKSTFGLILRADMFREHGEVGGKAYSQAVLKEIDRQFRAKTGGADLVGALGETLIGKASTLVDVIEIAGELIGTELIRMFGIKDTIDGATQAIDQLGKALKFVFEPLSNESFAGIEGVDVKILHAAGKLKGVFNQIEEWRERIIPDLREFVRLMLTYAFNAYETIAGLSFSFGGLSAVVSGAVLPVLGVLGSTIGFLILAGGTLAAMITPLLIALGFTALFLLGALIPIGILLTSLGLGVMAVAVGFTMFKKDSETTAQAVWRLAIVIKTFLVQVLTRLWALGSGFVEGVLPGLRYGFDALWEGVKAILEPLSVLWGVWGNFFGAGMLSNMKTWAALGQFIGYNLGFVIAVGAKAVAGWLHALGRLIKMMSGNWLAMASDIYLVGKAFTDFVNGTGSAGVLLKTTMLAILDIMLTPFRMFFSMLAGVVAEGLTTFAAKVAPWNTELADQIDGAATAIRSAGDRIMEGFLKTDELFKGGIKVEVGGTIKTTQPIDIKIDGQKIAEAAVETEVRARNAGRGGDPVTPEELGFVIEGGNRIRPVLPNEVAKDF